MGKKLKRLKGGSKGHKWKKGQSCISNPETTKYRELAAQGFFTKISDSNLTEDAVAKHEKELKGMVCGAASFAGSMAASVAPSMSVLSTPLTATTDGVNIGYNRPQHTMPKTVIDLQRDMEEMSVVEDDLKSQAKTFATRYTTCSIPAFQNFIDKMSVQSEHQVLMLAFHAAVQDIIKQKDLPESPSSYFIAIIMSLEGFLDNPEQVAAGLALLVRVIKSVPLTVLRTKCSTFAAVLNTIIRQYQGSDNVQLITHVLGCVSILLRAQHLGSWYQDDKLKEMLKNVLVFTMHGEARIRKSGQYNVSAVLKGSEFMVTSPLRTMTDCEDKEQEDMEEASSGETDHKVEAVHTNGALCNGDASGDKDEEALEVHPAAELVGDFLIGQLKSSGSLSSANKSILHMLVFTRQVIMAMPKHKLQTLLKRLFGLVSLANGLVNTTILQALQALCAAHPPASVLPQTLTDNLLSTLTKHKAGVSAAIIAAPHDPVAVEAWSAVVTAALGHAIRLSPDAGIKWCADWCKLALQYWRSDNLQVLTTMERSISAALGNVYDAITLENCATHESGVRSIIQELEAGLSYQYQGAWPCVFRLLGQCYSELGLYYAPMMMPSLKNLCQLMANNNLASATELEKAIGKAVQGLGVEAVVFSAPLSLTGDIAIDEKNLWLLPLLRKFVRASRLVFFKDHFIPLAEKCFGIISNLKSEAVENPRLLSTYKTIEYQIWALLPSFANQAIDVEEAQSNKTFAKLICKLIEHSDRSRIDAMAALRHMMVADGSSTGRLARNANNYLPALFNVFVKEPKNSKNANKPDVIEGSHRLAAIATIVAYLKIVPQTLSNTFMKSILEKYKLETKQQRKHSLLHLARCFVPHVTGELVQSMIETIEPLIRSAKDRREQKAAYRILEEVLAADSKGTEEFINDQLLELSVLLLESKTKAGASSKAPRMRCARVVLGKVSSSSEIETREHFLVNIVGESVICCGRSNSTAARKAAFLLLADLPQAMKRIQEADDDTTVRECMRLLSGGLLGRPTLCANTIIAITAFTYQTKEYMPVDILQQNVGNMCALLECSAREVVQACLSFVKGVVSLFPVSVLGPMIKGIMAGIVSMTPDCARKYRLKTRNILARLMRKFGDDFICKLVPTKYVTLHKRLRNLRKEASRMRRQREAEEKEDEEREEQEEDDTFSKKAPTSLEEILAEIDPDLVGADEDDTKKLGKSQRKKKGRPTAAWLEEDDSGDEVLDLLGPDAAQAIMTKKPREKREFTKEEQKEVANGGFAIDPASGKLIIEDLDKEDKYARNSTQDLDDGDMEDMLHMKAGAQSGKIENKRRRAAQDDDDDDSIDIPLPKRPKKKNNFDYGAEFRSNKSAGDMKRKGRCDPYAFIEITRDRLNKRKQAKFKGQFKAILRGGAKGVKQGTKLRKSGSKNRG